MRVVADELEFVIALCGPLVEAALDVVGAANFEEEVWTGAAGGEGCSGAEEAGVGGEGAGGAGGGSGGGVGGEWGVGEPEHVDVARLVFVGEGFEDFGLETGDGFGGEGAGDEADC